MRKCVDLYKEAKKVSADVTDITMEVSGFIGNFLEAKDAIETHVEEEKKTPVKKRSKSSSLNAQAFENVMRAEQLKNAETELKNFMIYETPGLGDIWTRFANERQRLREELAAAEAEEARQRAKLAIQRRRKLEQYTDWFIWGTSTTLVALFACWMFYALVEDRKVRWGAWLHPRHLITAPPPVYAGKRYEKFPALTARY